MIIDSNQQEKIMSLDATVLQELKRQSEEWNRKNITAPRYGENGGDTKSPFEVIGQLIGKLAKRVEELEKRPTVKYMGVHKPGGTYSEGSLVTRDGSIFHTNKTTTAMPGDGSQDWALAVKRGKDAR
jgi:hypothetical protein